jgi:hypothetical protein
MRDLGIQARKVEPVGEVVLIYLTEVLVASEAHKLCMSDSRTPELKGTDPVAPVAGELAIRFAGIHLHAG